MRPRAAVRPGPPRWPRVVAQGVDAARGAPAIAYFNCLNEGNLMRRMLSQPDEAPPHFNASTPLPRETQRALRRGYYAAVS